MQRRPRDRMSRREPTWRVVARPLNEFGDVVYDVYLEQRRLAWGLKDQNAADRWVARLAAVDPGELLGVEPELVDPGGSEQEDDALLEEVAPFTPRRVWWNE